jgi:putative membrane protein
MPQLFMDPLDLWLDVLGTTLLATAYWVYLNFASKAPVSVKSTFNKSFGYFYLGLGIYALASGLWATATWPLPSSYNLVFSDAWPLFGVALITLGLVVARWGARPSAMRAGTTSSAG